MEIEQRAMSASFTIPKHWRRAAYAQGFSNEKIAVMEYEFKKYYAKSAIKLTDIAWERRFMRWIKTQRRPLYHPAPAPIASVAPEHLQEASKPINPSTGQAYLAKIKQMLAMKESMQTS